MSEQNPSLYWWENQSENLITQRNHNGRKLMICANFECWLVYACMYFAIACLTSLMNLIRNNMPLCCILFSCILFSILLLIENNKLLLFVLVNQYAIDIYVTVIQVMVIGCGYRHLWTKLITIFFWCKWMLFY